jgi:hypothetical protein
MARLLPLLLLSAAPFAAMAQQPDKTADLPGPVADWIAQARRDCPGGFHADGAVQSVSLTGDGRPGYIADPHRLACDQSPTLYGGLGPASIELFVTLPSGQLVHSAGVLALGYRVAPSPDGGLPIVIFDTHGAGERAGSADNYRWDGHNFTMIDHRSLALPPDQ